MIHDMPRPRYPHILKETTRHDKTVWYFRLGKGKRIRLPDFGAPDFQAAYDAALAGEEREAPAKAGVNTFKWLVDRYKGSTSWAELSAATRRQRENILRGVIEKFGDKPLSVFTKKAIAAGRDKRKATPNMARHFVVTMRGLFQWALEADYVTVDPTQGVKSPRPRTDGHHVWTQAECDKFEARWALGTRERLAFDLLLYTGLRRGDACKLGRQHVRNGVISIKTEKTGETVVIPLLAPLQDSIAATVTGDLTFIVGEHGRGFTKESFGNWFGDICRKTGVKGTAHGLRKAGATRAAEQGASESELEAIFGWRGGRMASLYTRQANRERLAKKAAEKLLPGQG